MLSADGETKKESHCTDSCMTVNKILDRNKKGEIHFVSWFQQISIHYGRAGKGWQLNSRGQKWAGGGLQLSTVLL